MEPVHASKVRLYVCHTVGCAARRSSVSARVYYSPVTMKSERSAKEITPTKVFQSRSGALATGDCVDAGDPTPVMGKPVAHPGRNQAGKPR